MSSSAETHKNTPENDESVIGKLADAGEHVVKGIWSIVSACRILVTKTLKGVHGVGKAIFFGPKESPVKSNIEAVKAKTEEKAKPAVAAHAAPAKDEHSDKSKTPETPKTPASKPADAPAPAHAAKPAAPAAAPATQPAAKPAATAPAAH